MENASKALIIAGAILLAILLISLGIYIFSQAQSVVNDSGFTKAEITTFNSQFLKYDGEQKGTAVKSLITEVITSNASDTASNNGRFVSVTYGQKKIDSNTNGLSTSDIKACKTYQITLATDSKTGYINSITIADK